MDNIRYWTFKHKPGEKANEDKCKELILQAVRNNYVFMQYEYGFEDTRKVTQNWNRVREVSEGDVIFLRGDKNIYAYGYAIRPRLEADIKLKMQDIIYKRDHGEYKSSNYSGIIHFEDSDVFYENLDGEENWGQRIDVDSWRLYYENGIPAQSQDLYQQGENGYGVLKELKPEKGKEIINELYNYLGMKGDVLSLLKANHNLILTGAPGTGKTYLAKQVARLLLFGKTNELNDVERKQFNEQCGFVQFHPSYDYTDFVEGLRPKQDENGTVGFERRDGVFKNFCKTAVRNPNKKYVMIIDEINRGEISKIFGELFFSIDPGYRGTDGKVKTQYQNLVDEDDEFYEGFFVPKNVYIIGTMNDIDRSVESMDFAFRRRFAFKEIKADENVGMLDDLKWKDEAISRMKNLNAAIEKVDGLSSAYHIGASYFLKLANYRNDNGEYDKKSFTDLWDNHLEGLLREYLRGMQNVDEKIEKLKAAYNNESNPDNR